MVADRCRVCVHAHGTTQYYQRDSEERRDGRWVAVPQFRINRSEGVIMAEAQAVILVGRLRGLRADPWIETADGRRIDVPREGQSFTEDTRQPMIATLDDEAANPSWYLIRPANTPGGKKWFLKVRVPGLADEQTIYENDPIAVLQRVQALNWLQFVPRYERPVEQPAAPQQNSRGFRRRPGDLYQ
jgi:hypothetical protein